MRTTTRRFHMRVAGLLKPLLLLFLTAGRNSYVEVGEGRARFRFGPLFDNSIELANIASVAAGKWPILGGLGWRTSFTGLVALTGSYGGIVEVRLHEKTRVKGILPFPGFSLNCDRIIVSLKDPEGFIDAVRSAKATQ